MKTGTLIVSVIALAIAVFVYIYTRPEPMGPTMPQMRNSQMMNSQMMNSQMNNMEGFANSPADQVISGSGVSGSEDITYVNIEQPQELSQNYGTGSQMNSLPSECYPKDVMSSADLLPNDANSLWAQVSPSSQGSLADQNFLTSGFHIGINTVGQTLRNANRQIRSEPLNPQVKVSPWMQTTIDADINRRPLEIEGNL